MSSSSLPEDLPSPPEIASSIFGDRLGVASAFVAILADTGVSHGLIGPREVPRLWDRHVLNCAVIGEAMPERSVPVVDVGSGAGLPGVALAIARPDLQVHLVEPMARRTAWLSTTVESLGLTNVEVHRGRAVDFRGSLSGRYVTARAVARLPKLLAWCAPLTDVGGHIVAMKGTSASEELGEARPVLKKWHLADARVTTVGDALPDPTTVVILRRGSRR
jgi:16S rRNA (guanine527-N7)-methyltransferase